MERWTLYVFIALLIAMFGVYIFMGIVSWLFKILLVMLIVLFVISLFRSRRRAAP